MYREILNVNIEQCEIKIIHPIEVGQSIMMEMLLWMMSKLVEMLQMIKMVK